jgi:hypothetical protein
VDQRRNGAKNHCVSSARRAVRVKTRRQRWHFSAARLGGARATAPNAGSQARMWFGCINALSVRDGSGFRIETGRLLCLAAAEA